MNPILSGTQQPIIMQRALQMKKNLQVMKSMSNPKAMVDMMLKNNPNAAAIKKLIEDNGGDFEKAGRALAKEKGIDPEEILKVLM